MKKEVDKDAYKRIPFEILLYITDFCEKNQIRYSLAYGTLLGAIRHKGFIPWDDDIDIIMPRADFERFKSLYHSKRYPLSDISVDVNHPTAMAKVYDSQTYFYTKGIKRSYGLFVDLFVVDNFPSDKVERIHWQKRTRFLLSINSAKNTGFASIIRMKTKFPNKLKLLLAKLLPTTRKHIQNRINELSQKYNDKSTGLVGITMSRDNPFDTYPAYVFEEFIDVEFEKRTFKAIRHYDIWLKKCYGDYMKLPPIEKRKGIHSIVAYYK